ncbi:hypothetical protein RND81_11G072300 [Saponaria officinalis]|uniref:Uncharacterized protein n=1 Tax=Saponaria officinalis TaxID=3572 RepID=A0AAW1HIW4_SAPOF
MGSSERKKWLLALFTALTISIFLSISIISGLTRSPYSTLYGTSATVSPPSFGYYIHGGAGDKEQVMRLLLAVYHPRNRYLLHLVADASDEERDWLLEALMSVPAVQAFENVDASDEEGDWPGKPLWLTGMGATHLAATLRAVAILLKLDGGWDWFISLNAYDYPLLTQDDGDIQTQQISVKCRAKRLLKLITKLNDTQRSAVKRIGFGGILKLKIQNFPLSAVRFFLDCFNDGQVEVNKITSQHFVSKLYCPVLNFLRYCVSK